MYLKSRNYRLFLQTQRDFALKSLGIHKGFLRLFALHPACVYEISVIFFVFRYTLAKHFALGQHRTIPALRLKHRSGSCSTASALPKCSIMSGCGTRIVLRGQKPLALCDRCPCFGSLFPPLAALTFAAQSIICAFGLASAAPRSPYQHLELCGIALTLLLIFFICRIFLSSPISPFPPSNQKHPRSPPVSPGKGNGDAFYRFKPNQQSHCIKQAHRQQRAGHQPNG